VSDAGLGGLPAQRPDQLRSNYPPTGVQPGSATGIIRARLVIISGTSGGVFVYNGTPALGNPPIVSITAASTDPYGNAVIPGLDVTEGSITGTVITGASITGATITGTTFDGTDFVVNQDGMFFYSSTPGVFLGTNHGSFTTVEAAVGTLLAFRGYNFQADGIPSAYPGTNAGPIPAGVTVPVISFYPPQISAGAFYDVVGLKNGTYDSFLTAYFSSVTVPAGGTVYMTCFHEGESNIYAAGEPAPVRNGTAAEYAAMHAHLHTLCSTHAPAGVKYGQIFSSFSENTGSSSYPLAQWVAPGMDFYGIDGYEGSSADTIANQFDTPAAAIETVQTAPLLLVPETNSYLEADRPLWFADVAQWCTTNGAPVMCTFWGSAPYAWVAGDTATIAELTSILDNPPTVAELIASVAPVAGTDASGNAYLAGLAAYEGNSAVAIEGNELAFASAPGVAGPWTVSVAVTEESGQLEYSAPDGNSYDMGRLTLGFTGLTINSSTVPVVLASAPVAVGRYAFRGYVIYANTTAAAPPNFEFTGPATTSANYWFRNNSVAAGTVTATAAIKNALAATFAGGNANTAGQILEYEGEVVFSASGTFTLEGLETVSGDSVSVTQGLLVLEPVVAT
jgi:hypothetical protein